MWGLVSPGAFGGGGEPGPGEDGAGGGVSIEGAGISIEGAGTSGGDETGGGAEAPERGVDGFRLSTAGGPRESMRPVIQSINGLKRNSQLYPRTIMQGESRGVT